MRCAECGAETADATQTCALCGAPISQQRSVAAASVPGGVEDAVAQCEPAPADDQQVPQHVPASKRTGPGSRRRALALAGVGLGLLVAVIVAIGVANSSSGGQLTEDQLQPGDCLTGSNLELGTGSTWPYTVTAVPCTQPHEGEVFFSGNVWPQSLSAYPGKNTVITQGYSRCNVAFTAYDGIDSSGSAFQFTDILPLDATDWASGDRLLVCVAFIPDPWTPAGGVPVKYSIKGSRR
jgi:hypothetical protein